jgi:hypothetical protein
MGTQAYRNKEGKRVPSVTTVLGNIGWSKDGLVRWANKQGIEGITLEQARVSTAGVGTKVHELIERALRGDMPEPSDPFEKHSEAWCAFQGWLAWAETTQIDPISIEIPLLSEAMQIGGTPDLIAHDGGNVVLFDWKTYGSKVNDDEKKPWSEYWIQGVAYAAMWNETHNVKIDTVSIVMIDKIEGVATEHREAIGSPRCLAALEAFMLARRLHDLNKEIGKKAKAVEQEPEVEAA